MQRPLWGLLGPEKLVSQRRTRTLGLGAVVRAFNDRAVPGLGGVWFGKQLYLATLGVAVAQEARAQGKRVGNIEVANALEALACWLAYEENGWSTDPRLRGRTKMQYRTRELIFPELRKPSFYVTQPMRRGTVQALPALGLVETNSPRFNSFRLETGPEDLGEQLGRGFKLINAVCADLRPHNKTVPDVLTNWVMGGEKTIDTWPMREALSPLSKISKHARNLLRGCLEGDDSRRRALRWVEDVRIQVNRKIVLEDRPAILKEGHWRDLCAGTRFFATRDAALALLGQIETHIGESNGKTMRVDEIGPIRQELEAVRERAREYLNSGYSEDGEATRFCKECSDASDQRILCNVVERDGRVLHLSDDVVELDPVFRGQTQGTGPAEANTEDEGAEEEVTVSLPFPEHMSPRIRNLYYLNLDLQGKLSGVLQ